MIGKNATKLSKIHFIPLPLENVKCYIKLSNFNHVTSVGDSRRINPSCIYCEPLLTCYLLN